MASKSRRAALLGASLGLVFSLTVAAPSRAQNQNGFNFSFLDTPDPTGVLGTVTRDGTSFDLTNPFFQSLGTNGRSCVSCHVPSSGWTITPPEIQLRFALTNGLDPIFRTVDGSNSPNADVSTFSKRQTAFSMLLNKGLIRIGLAIPAGAEFKLIAIDDPYNFASAAQLSLFRRPLPSTNLRFLTTVMWDGRESFAPLGTTSILATNTPAQNATALFSDLMHQANDATTGHAQSAQPLTTAQATEIVNFELNLATAQLADFQAGILSTQSVFGGPANLVSQSFYVTINDVLGADVTGAPFVADAGMVFAKAWLEGASGDRRRSPEGPSSSARSRSRSRGSPGSTTP